MDDPRIPLKPAIRRVMAFLAEHGPEEAAESDRRKYAFIRAELSDLHDWITEDDEEHAPCIACGEYAPKHATGCAVCAHMHVLVLGNDETGLRSIKCEDCGDELSRERDAGGFEFRYVRVPE